MRKIENARPCGNGRFRKLEQQHLCVDGDVSATMLDDDDDSAVCAHWRFMVAHVGSQWW